MSSESTLRIIFGGAVYRRSSGYGWRIHCLLYTSIAGWYGMNVHMPEVGWPYSYPVIILASIIVTIIEILIFKKKKWF